MLQDLCTAIAVGLHYILLTAFFLMIAEGCWIIHVVVNPLNVKNISPLLIALAFGLFYWSLFMTISIYKLINPLSLYLLYYLLHLTTLNEMRRPLYMITLLVFYSKERMYVYEGLNDVNYS